VSLFQTIVTPKLLYGLEIVKLTKTERDHLNAQGRSCLKLLLGVSKHSRNYIHEAFSIPEVTMQLNRRKVKLISQMLQNRAISGYLLHLMTTKDRLYSTADGLIDACGELGLDLVEIALGGSFTKEQKTIRSENAIQCLRFIDNWHLRESRNALRELLEASVEKRK
jgi:hypothetical protein